MFCKKHKQISSASRNFNFLQNMLILSNFVPIKPLAIKLNNTSIIFEYSNVLGYIESD